MTEPPSPAAILALATAFERSQILFALVELRVPELLAERARTADEVADALGAAPLAVRRLLEAGVTLGLLERAGARFRCSPIAERHLVPGAEGDLAGILRRYERMARSGIWARLPEQLVAWRPGTRGLAKEAAPTGAEMEGIHRLALLTGAALADAVDLRGFRRLLDLGGGTGGVSMALCARCPELHAVVVERPEMAPAARARVEASGFGERIEVCAGDFVAGPLPPGGDVALLANVVSMLAPDVTRSVFTRLFAHLAPGGAIVVSGWMLDDEEQGPLLPLLLSLEDILLDAPDVEHSAKTYADWLTAAGFADVTRVRYLDPLIAVVGRKPPRVEE